jgi:two-component system sensor histidine kinase ResE
MGYLGLLEKTLGDRLSKQEVTFMENARRGTERMDSLLTDILNLEKIESQREAAWQDVQIVSILGDVVDSLRAQAEFKSQAYVTTLLEEDVIVKGSETQLKQAFTNFVGNAIKYTQEEGTVQIRSEIKDSRFYFEVEDNGYGIPEERQEHLFERFYRAHTPGTEHIEGTGLGLSLVKSVIERHGGEVWFSSEVDKGSTFGFWLPLSKNNN